MSGVERTVIRNDPEVTGKAKLGLGLESLRAQSSSLLLLILIISLKQTHWPGCNLDAIFFSLNIQFVKKENKGEKVFYKRASACILLEKANREISAITAAWTRTS